ncbi:hypothetical protein BDZ45DRAFT_599234 [Acephala macrosclerotiorum]|nr:hypothetical protein BDZ45DRAFT_599234 [Acephala macrosclerotiorum]
MDRKPHPIATPNPRPTSSVYSDDGSIMASLMRNVAEEIRLQEYQTIATYMRENQQLAEEAERYRIAWNQTIKFLNQAICSITSIHRALASMDSNVTKAEKDWLAFWGIYKERPGQHPAFL